MSRLKKFTKPYPYSNQSIKAPARQQKLTGFFLVGLLYACNVVAEAAVLPAASNSVSQPKDVRGLVKARHEAVIRSDIAAKVAQTPVRTGETFKKNDLLIRFDCERQKAEAAAARAAYAAAKSRYDSSIEMKKFDAAGQFDVSIAKAEMDEASARSRAMRVQIARCDIKAPFDGKVAELNVNAHETPGSEQALLKIVGSTQLELRLIVPSNWLVWLSPGASFTFTVDETGAAFEAKIASIGAEVDAVSRTVPIMAKFDGLPAGVLPGMSGSAHFEKPGQQR